MIGLRNCGHLGRVGDWADMAAAAGQVSLHFLNTSGAQCVAPYGGSDRRLSTNPITIGVPIADADPVVLDVTTSMVAEGKLMVALNKGERKAGRMDHRQDGARPRTQDSTTTARCSPSARKGVRLFHGDRSPRRRGVHGKSSTPTIHPAQQHAVDLHRAGRVRCRGVVAREARRFVDFVKSSTPRKRRTRAGPGTSSAAIARAPGERRCDRRQDLGGPDRGGASVGIDAKRVAAIVGP
jgi:hypothetical protein